MAAIESARRAFEHRRKEAVRRQLRQELSTIGFSMRATWGLTIEAMEKILAEHDRSGDRLGIDSGPDMPSDGEHASMSVDGQADEKDSHSEYSSDDREHSSDGSWEPGDGDSDTSDRESSSSENSSSESSSSPSEPPPGSPAENCDGSDDGHWACDLFDVASIGDSTCGEEEPAPAAHQLAPLGAEHVDPADQTPTRIGVQVVDEHMERIITDTVNSRSELRETQQRAKDTLALLESLQRASLNMTTAQIQELLSASIKRMEPARKVCVE